MTLVRGSSDVRYAATGTDAIGEVGWEIALLDLRINQDITVEGGVLNIKGARLTRFRLDREFPRGANGVAFAGRHEILGVPRVVKIWLAQRSNDDRDKLRQGIAEAHSMSLANPDWVATVHDADTVNGYFIASMELLEGSTLKDHLATVGDKYRLWWLARLYINGIDKITTATLFHGDPHWKNVIVFEHVVDKYDFGNRLKFIDFGTSKVGQGAISRERHWRIVNDTFAKILRSFKGFIHYRDSYDKLIAQPMPASVSKADVEYANVMMIARFDDILDDLKIEAGFYQSPSPVAV